MYHKISTNELDSSLILPPPAIYKSYLRFHEHKTFYKIILWT